MKFPIPPQLISDAFLNACKAELQALKPGNVHIHADGHDMDVTHFEKAAEAAARHIAQKGATIGRRVVGGVEASLSTAGCNTNLGIILLCAPLAYAAGEVVRGETLSTRLAAALAGLQRNDAEDVFQAIAAASPGGLGDAATGDVRSQAEISLLEAMRLAAGRDRIALAYVTGYADIFEFALPLFKQVKQVAETPELAVTTLHMNLLARSPDTHISRKFGPQAAVQVRDEARERLANCPSVATPAEIPNLAAFDADLKSRGLNPGTTADFVVATLFTDALSTQVAEPRGV